MLQQENKGSGSARNWGIREARGECIAFMDSDDWYPSNDVLESLYNMAKVSGENISGGSLLYWDGEIKLPESLYIFSSDSRMDFSDYQIPHYYQRFIYSRRMLLEGNIIFPDYLRGQDPPFFVNAMLSSGSFYAISKPTYCYRIGHKKVNWDIKKSNDRMQSIIDLLEVSVIYKYSRLHVFALKNFQGHYCEYISSKTDINNPEFQKLIQEANNYVLSSIIKQEYSSVILNCVLPFGLIFKNSSGNRCLRRISYLKSKLLSYCWATKILYQRGELAITLVKKIVRKNTSTKTLS